MITVQDLTGLTVEQALGCLAGKQVCLTVYAPPRGEHAGTHMRVVQVKQDAEGWELVICGFPLPLDENKNE